MEMFLDGELLGKLRECSFLKWPCGPSFGVGGTCLVFLSSSSALSVLCEKRGEIKLDARVKSY